jgi:surfactin synthase thioesterase subunit
MTAPPPAGSAIRSWVRGVGVSHAPVRLFCFPHAGAGYAFFRPWLASLQPDVEVCPVVLPGRESRARERPFRRMEQLIPALFDVLSKAADRPFAIFGHSLGAIIGYELARAFARSAHGPPLRLFVSGRRAPHLAPRLLTRHLLPDAELVRIVSSLNGTPGAVLQSSVLDAFLPCLRADFELNETYLPLPGGRLDCPVHALTGDADPEVRPDEMTGWRETTTADFSVRVFPGDHFYLRGPPPELASLLRAELRT